MKKINSFILVLFASLLFVFPTKVYAKTNYVITIKQFESESKAVATEVKSYYNSYIEKLSTCETKVVTSNQEFIDVWNEISAESQNGTMGMIIVNTHGGPTYINGGELYFTTADVYSLDLIKCDYLLLLGCNCGHAAYQDTNIASVFLKMVTGTVVAADGSDKTGMFNGSSLFTQSFTAISNTTWLEYETNGGGSRTDNYGWAIYKREVFIKPTAGTGYTTGASVCTYTNFKKLTMKTILNYLITGNSEKTPKKI